MATRTFSTRAYRVCLRLFQMLPKMLRRWIVRIVSPSFTVGAICVIERPDGHILLVRQA